MLVGTIQPKALGAGEHLVRDRLALGGEQDHGDGLMLDDRLNEVELAAGRAVVGHVDMRRDGEDLERGLGGVLGRNGTRSL